jgi:hypothetical protein
MCRVQKGDARKWLAEMIDTLQHDDHTKVFMGHVACMKEGVA